MLEDVRIGGKVYSLKLTRERQIVDGIERASVVDHDRQEIRYSAAVRLLIIAPIQNARATQPPAPVLAAISSRPSAPAPELIPVRVSGCFCCWAIPWPAPDLSRRPSPRHR